MVQLEGAGGVGGERKSVMAGKLGFMELRTERNLSWRD